MSMDADAQELLPVFLQEMQEHLNAYEAALLKLEKADKPGPIQTELFRVLHTLKGGCALFGFRRIGELIHTGESLISGLRDGKVARGQELTSTLLELGDVIRLSLEEINVHGREPQQDYAPMQARLEALLRGPAQGPEPEPPETHRPVSAEIQAEAVPIAPEASDALFAQRQRVAASSDQLQVDVSLLNRLLDRASELLLLRHSFQQFRRELTAGHQGDYQLLCMRYQALAGELQEALMEVRMQPIGLLWKTYPRMLRELGQRFGKQLTLETSGEDTELDKSVLDAIRDPLMHLIRNAVDHGIEAPLEREHQGKPSQGTIRLRAYQDEGFIFVELLDDGRGLDWEGIRSKAVERGMMTPSQAESAGQDALLRLIFQPGFSTASAVTELSGRGVGMDVVHSNLVRIGGALEVTSIAGAGTCFRLRLPLTLALLPALLIRQQDQVLAIPQHHIRAILAIPELEVLNLGEGSCFRWQGRNLPLGHLDQLLRLPESQSGFCVVLQSETSFGLAVEEVLEISEIAIKALSSHWAVYPLMAGATILGTGEMALVLSLAELEARICRERAQAAPAATALPEFEVEEAQTLLLFRDSRNSLLALALEQVLHLEVFVPEQLLELPAGKLVSRRGELIPVIDIAAALAATPLTGLEPPTAMVVCEKAGRKLGLLVTEIVDITGDRPEAAGPSLRAGIEHTLELPWGAAEVLDPEFIWKQLWQAAS
ncbi:MAG TPA: chemotaxis protein CheW [Candidatus Obscuribacterales bacterium]